MAHSYTPGLTVTERTVVRKKRLLPIAGSVMVQIGDRVEPESIVARTELPGKVHVLNVANLLGVAPDEVQEYLAKKPGEPVKRDEIIAETHPFIKWFKTEVRSPIYGQLESASPVTGQVLLREPPRSLELLGYVTGHVVEVHPKQGVTVETGCSLVQGIFGIGGETWGDLKMAVESPEEQLTSPQLNPDMKGKIVVGGSFIGAESMARARGIGVAAVVVGGIHDKDLRDLLGYDLGVAITGTERVGFTLVLTEGFGTIPMARKTFQLLSRHAGQRASISGATQIRAGVIRPEIIIPRKDNVPQAGEDVPMPGSSLESSGIRVGAQVRIIRDPLFGRIGRVLALPPELRQIETESHVRVLEVQFPDRSTAVIPRANVEIIEG
jgi:hypothetical protein